jgi:hypothetical protein
LGAASCSSDGSQAFIPLNTFFITKINLFMRPTESFFSQCKTLEQNARRNGNRAAALLSLFLLLIPAIPLCLCWIMVYLKHKGI